MQNHERPFLNQLDTKLWQVTDKLRNNLDTTNYKHVVLGLICLKSISDTFTACREGQMDFLQVQIEGRRLI